MVKKSMVVAGVLMLMTLPITAQKIDVIPETHCDPNFTGNDIGASFPGQPMGGFVLASGDCTAVAGCDDYFDIDCAGGETITGTFCSDGGTADFDTGISTWDPAVVMTDCNDDTCGLQSELTTVLPAAAGIYRVRIGGFGGDSGTYTMAFQAPATCTIVGAVPVELQTFDVD